MPDAMNIEQSPNQIAPKEGNMAISKAKRSRKNKQLNLPKPRLTHFRELKGKTVEDVVFSTAPDHQDITIKLQDKTGLSFSIATGIILKTEYSDWTSGEQRILRAWLLNSRVR